MPKYILSIISFQILRYSLWYIWCLEVTFISEKSYLHLMPLNQMKCTNVQNDEKLQLWKIKKIWQSMLTLGIILLSRQSKCVTNSCYRGQWVRLYRILQNWEIRETGNLSCEYFCNWQSCPSKGWLCRESSETVLKKVEIGKNLRKHFLENISFRLFQNFFFNTPCTAMWKKKQFWRFGKNGLVTHSAQ